MIQESKKLVKYLIRPNLEIELDIGFTEKFKNSIYLFILKLLIAISIILLIKSLFNVENIKISQLNEWSIVEIFIYGCLLVPILEELVFRLPLVFKPSYFAISSFILNYVLISKVYFKIGYLNVDEYVFVRLIFASIVAALVFYYSRKNFSKIKLFWKNNFRFLYYFSILLFGLLHGYNFEFSNESLAILPLVTFPQILDGIINGYVRIKYGFVFCCILHVLNNFIALMS